MHSQALKFVRAAMGVYMFSPGYLTNKNKEKAKIKAVVDAAIANGMYVLVDWHYTSDEIFEEAAKQFFKEMSTEYRGVPNVLYEIYNEPVIRANDKDAIIICGTPCEGGADQLRKVVEIALKRKFPIFVTEYGLTLGTGDGPINEQQTNLWWNLLDKYGVSYINWSICNKKENSAALKPGSTPKDVWQDSALTNSGRIVKRMLISKNPVPTGC
uniref:Glycoside hydrolase family 5 domain-containing protein n=1 Tax=Meloidogyne javanica TaxID=6303 RepID=A0A915LGY3_MELJA